MVVLISLLERKNLCFRSFHKLCEEFIDQVSKGDTAGLEQFQKRRQGLIKVLEQLEFEVTHWLDGFRANPRAPESLMTAESRVRMDALLRQKDGLVKSILDLDLQIMGHIDRIKDETIRKLQALQNGRKTINAYRSPIESVETAEGAGIVDRKA